MRVLLFGDQIGIPQLLRHIPVVHLCGLVVAANRPQYHEHVKAIATALNLPFLIQPLPSSSSYVKFKSDVEELAPDLILVYSYSLILRDDVLSVPQLGGINIHGALLPEYRGCNPTEWAIINGESVTGVTMHEISTGIDEGRIIDRALTPILIDDTWREATDRVIAETDHLIARNLDAILSGNWVSTAQDETKAHYCRRRFFEDGRFDWGQPVLEIYNIVRALVFPHPGASYIHNNASLVVISERKTFAEITLLKYENSVGGFLRGTEVDLIPIAMTSKFIEMKSQIPLRDQAALPNTPPPAPQNIKVKRYLGSGGSIDFSMTKTANGSVAGWCRIQNILWDEGIAEVSLDFVDGIVVSGALEVEVVGLITRYAVQELKLGGISILGAGP